MLILVFPTSRAWFWRAFFGQHVPLWHARHTKMSWSLLLFNIQMFLSLRNIANFLWISGHHHHELVSQRRSIWLIFINQPLIWKLFTPIAKHVGLWHLHQSEDRLATHGCSKWWREVHRSSWVVRSPVGGWIPNDGPTKHGWFRRWFQLFSDDLSGRWFFMTRLWWWKTLSFLKAWTLGTPWNSIVLVCVLHEIITTCGKIHLHWNLANSHVCRA